MCGELQVGGAGVCPQVAYVCGLGSPVWAGSVPQRWVHMCGRTAAHGLGEHIWRWADVWSEPRMAEAGASGVLSELRLSG